MPTRKPYARFKPEDLILRDELAIDRTLLSNERTLMSYIRLGISMIIAGFTIIHFSSTTWFNVLGIVCIPLGVAVGLFGIARFRNMNGKITAVRKKMDSRPERD